MFTIFRFTFREAFSKKVLLVSAIMAVVFLGLYGAGVFFAARDITRSGNQVLASVIYPQLTLFGLYFGGFIVSFLAIISSAGIISGEIESGAIQAVITKPLRRSGFALGRFLGQGVFLGLYSALLFAAIYAIIRVFTGTDLSGVWRALPVFSLQPVVILSLAMLASTLTGTLAAGTLTFTLYALAVVGGFIEQIGWIINNLYMKNAGIISSLIMPVDALYRKTVHILLPQQAAGPAAALQQMGPFGSMAEPSRWMMVYTLLYIAFCLGLTLYYFDRKDI